MKVGQVLGHYHVIRTLGRGGMGAVYEASDTRLNRQVALKVLPARMAKNPEWFKRFEREAQAVAALNHPNIVTIHSVEEADDVHFIILELVGGKTLEELIPEGGLDLETFFEIAIPLTDALAAAHKRGIAHRDLKPSNVMVDDEGRVKVLDFGIAKLVEDVPEDEAATQVGSEALTEEGKIVGTVAYMSPEQAEGKAADHRSDIFSLGIMLYEMATGDRPFIGDTKLSIMASIVKDDPPTIIERNADMPRHLARIVKKALEKDLNRRYQSMVEVRNDLIELKEEIDAGEQVVTGTMLTDPGIEAYRRPPETAAWWKWVAVGGIVVALAAVGWALLGPAGAPPPPRVSIDQLTTSGTDFGGTISPDGQWFAFSRANGDSIEIRLQSIGTRNSIPLNVAGVSPEYSRSGELIAYSGRPLNDADFRQGGGIWIMGPTGDNPRDLTESGFNPSWSPDGNRIVYADEYVQANPYSRTSSNSRLHVIDTTTGASETLVIEFPGGASPDAVQPAWSPNGLRIAFWGIVGGRGQRDIWTVPAEGGMAVAVTQDEAIDFSPIWSPDGTWLYFASTRGGSMAIWRVAIDEETGRTGEPEQITTGGLTEPGMLSFSADGSRLLYTETLTRGTIRSADFDPEALVLTSAVEPVVQGSRRIAQPDISSDGQRIVYRSGGAQQDLFVVAIDGSGEQQITDDAAKDWAPAWAPDNSRIAFYSNRSGDYEVWTIDPDGTGPQRLTHRPEQATFEPVWSPDGERIAFYVDEEVTFFIDADADYENQQYDELPLVYPDRPQSAFEPRDWIDADPPIVGTFEGIHLFDPDNRTYRTIFEGGAVDATWMADQRRILFRIPGAEGFWVIDSVSGEYERIEAPGQAMVLSPENDRAYLVVQESESDIWMLEIGGARAAAATGSGR